MSRPVHVCFVTLSFGENSVGGVMNHMVALGRELREHGVAVTVLCPSYGEPWRYTHDGLFDVIGIQEPRVDSILAPSMIGFGWRCRRALIDLHREHPIDVIHLHDRPPILGALAVRRQVGAAVVYTAHSCFSRGTAQRANVPLSMGRLLERAIAPAGIPIIAVSTWVAEGMLALGANPDHVTVIHNGVDTSAYAYAGPAARDRREVLFVGRLDPDKGLDTLLCAIALVEERLHLTVIGEGDGESQYRRLAGDLGISDRVHFRGRVVGPELEAAYRRAGIFVLPSRLEPFGMVLLEAMASGTPVVATSTGGIVEVAGGRDTALLVPPDEPTAMAEGLVRILHEPEAAAARALRARGLVETHFSWEAAADRTLDVYRRAGMDVPGRVVHKAAG